MDRTNSSPLGEARHSSAAASATVFARHYELEQTVSGSSTSAVWRATDTRTGEQVALKFFPPELIRTPADFLGVRAAIAPARRFSHPALVAAREVATDSQYAAVVTPWVDAPTLTEVRLARSSQRLDPDDLREPLLQLVRLMESAHAAGVVHGSLHADVVFLRGDGGIRVTGFGVKSWLRLAFRARFGPRHPGTHARGASPAIESGADPGREDDIYAFGALLYEALTGAAPKFSGALGMSRRPTPMERMRRDRRHGGAPIPPDWEAVVQACLAANPEHRPVDFIEVRSRLGLIERATPVAARAIIAAQPAPPSVSTEAPAPVVSAAAPLAPASSGESNPASNYAGPGAPAVPAAASPVDASSAPHLPASVATVAADVAESRDPSAAAGVPPIVQAESVSEAASAPASVMHAAAPDVLESGTPAASDGPAASEPISTAADAPAPREDEVFSPPLESAAATEVPADAFAPDANSASQDTIASSAATSALESEPALVEFAPAREATTGEVSETPLADTMLATGAAREDLVAPAPEIVDGPAPSAEPARAEDLPPSLVGPAEPVIAPTVQPVDAEDELPPPVKHESASTPPAPVVLTPVSAPFEPQPQANGDASLSTVLPPRPIRRHLPGASDEIGSSAGSERFERFERLQWSTGTLRTIAALLVVAAVVTGGLWVWQLYDHRREFVSLWQEVVAFPPNASAGDRSELESRLRAARPRLDEQQWEILRDAWARRIAPVPMSEVTGDASPLDNGRPQ